MKENSTFKETTINTYLPELYEEFPYLDPKDIRKIVEFGWRSIYLANLSGCDVLVKSSNLKYWFYIGNLLKDSLKHFNYYRRLLLRKIEFLYRRILPDWDNFYYIGLTLEEAKDFNQIRKGRKRKKFKYYNKVVFKDRNMCSLFYNNCVCIIKFKYRIDVGIKHFFRILEILNPIVVEFRNPCKFKDILISTNNYKLK